jgi:hypothetical protein
MSRKYALKYYSPSSGLNDIFLGRGVVYPRPQTSEITATGGDKPHPYIDCRAIIEYKQRRIINHF